MANCKHCGVWAGVATDSHFGCRKMAESGMTNEQIVAELQRLSLANSGHPVPLSFRHIVGGVWLGTILAGLTLGIIYSILRVIQ